MDNFWDTKKIQKTPATLIKANIYTSKIAQSIWWPSPFKVDCIFMLLRRCRVW